MSEFKNIVSKFFLIIIQVNAMRLDTTFKIQLTAIKKLNFAHINEKKLIHNLK